MQFNLLNNQEMLAFLCIGVHDGAVCLAVSGLRHTCTSSRRSRGLSVAVIWNHVGRALCGLCFSLSGCFSAVVLSYFSASLLLPLPPFFAPSTVITVWRVPWKPCVWGLMAGLRGLLAVGAFYCLGAGWSQGRPLDIPATHLPLISMKLLNILKFLSILRLLSDSLNILIIKWYFFKLEVP